MTNPASCAYFANNLRLPLVRHNCPRLWAALDTNAAKTPLVGEAETVENQGQFIDSRGWRLYRWGIERSRSLSATTE